MKITAGPVAEGFAALYTPARTIPATASSTATSTTPAEVAVEYIERQSGNVYSFAVHGRTATRISNKTLPGIQEAKWLSDGSLAYVRYLDPADTTDQISTYALPARGEGGYFLEKNLADVAVQGTSTVFTLMTSTGGSIGTLATPSGTNVRTLFSSALSSLVVQFSGPSMLATTKASSALDGYAFTVDKNGSFSHILGPLRSLATLPSPSGSYVLYSYLDQGLMRLAVYDTAAHTAIALPLATLAEKCTWSSDSTTLYCGIPRTFSGNLPDHWYQGALAFSDRLWQIDLRTRTASLIVDPNQIANASIDAVSLTVDRTNDVLIFMNKTDGSLWAYDL
jgi:hypothetical protein